MRRKCDLPELLCPAGDFEALIAAVSAGADAVYVGGKSFSARAFAKNFDIEELTRAAEYCHLNNVKLYVTVNTLVFDRELEALGEYAARLWKIGIDAVICADLGAISVIKSVAPDLEIHASTQMSIHNTDGANLAYSMGCKRVVPARELSLKDIKSITEKSNAEIEIFLHGALCVSFSGQCLMSSLVGGRSGNRGECAQPCRLPYNGRYPLSLKDLSLAEHIPEIIESGVASLKIEGRMKSPEYVYRVTKIYRKLLDEKRSVTPEESEKLRKIFSRGGFTDGYFLGKTDVKMTGVRSDKDKEDSRELSGLTFEPDRIRVRAEVKIKLGEAAEMTLFSSGRSVTVCGAVVSEAKSSPLESSSVKERLSKMGNTFLSLCPEDISLSLDEGVNLPMSALNSLRREAAQRFQSCVRENPESSTPCEIKKQKKSNKKSKTALFFNSRTLREILLKPGDLLSDFDIVFLPLDGIDLISRGSVEGVYIPPVIFDSEMEEIEKLVISAYERGARYALVGNIGAIELARRNGLIPVGDFRLNVTNSAARGVIESLGVDEIILSPELTLPMARDVGGRVIVFGRIPLMLTERCFIKENFGCESCSKAHLTDRTGAHFPMMRQFPHRNIIFNSATTYMGDKKEDLGRASLFCEHFIFSTETADEIKEALLRYKRGIPLGGAVRRMGNKMA